MSWPADAPPLTMAVTCGGLGHRLRWERGRVETVDHPELEAELALVALGGDEPACIALHRLWQEAVDDGGFVAEWVELGRLSPTWLSWLGMALERMRTEGFHEFLRHLPPPRARRMGEFLHRFPPPWVDRAAAEVSQVAAEAEPSRWSEHGALLRQAGANRLRRAFVDAVGGRQLAVGAAALVPLVPLVDPDPGAPARIEGCLRGPDRRVSIVVDRCWLHRVWAVGAAVVDGQLVLAIDPDDPDDPDGPDGPAGTEARARVVVWTGGDGLRPELVTRSLRRGATGWELIGPPGSPPR